MSSSLLSRNIRVFSLLLVAILLVALLGFPALLYHKDNLGDLSGNRDGHADLRPRKQFHLLPINSGGAGPLFCKVLMSSLVQLNVHGYFPIILNWEAEGDSSYMQRLKIAGTTVTCGIPGVHEFLLGLHISEDNDVVFMMDARDVWLQLPPAVLLERYDELGSNMVIIGADMVCWPNDWEEPACTEVPESPVPGIAYEGLQNTPRWANSGTVLGTVRSMKAVYSDLVSQLSDTAVGDQGIFNEFLHQGRITVDYWSRLFWVTANNVNSGTILNTRHRVSAVKDDAIPYHLLPPMLYQSRTGEYPVALHFNDHLHKHLMNEWWGRLWWTKPSFRSVWEKQLEAGTAQFAHNRSTVRWGDLCGDIPT